MANREGLSGLATIEAGSSPVEEDPLEICDVHHHLGSLSAAEGGDDPGKMDSDYQNRVAMMTENKVDFVALLASTGYIQADGIKATMRQNDAIAAYRARDPKRFPIAAGIV